MAGRLSMQAVRCSSVQATAPSLPSDDVWCSIEPDISGQPSPTHTAACHSCCSQCRAPVNSRPATPRGARNACALRPWAQRGGLYCRPEPYHAGPQPPGAAGPAPPRPQIASTPAGDVWTGRTAQPSSRPQAARPLTAGRSEGRRPSPGPARRPPASEQARGPACRGGDARGGQSAGKPAPRIRALWRGRRRAGLCAREPTMG